MENRDVAANTLYKIRDLGVTISIDDFGTVYSSLAYLRSLPIDVVKIDRTFIKDIPDVEEDIAITRAILSMSKELGLKVVAEGVETQAHLDFLSKNHCEMMQGYLFSAPLPADQFDTLLRERKRLVLN